MRNRIAPVLGAAILALGASAAVHAGQSPEQENDAIADLSLAKVSITEAVAAAERAAGGKATRAGLENEGAGLIYKVEVANPATRKVMNVRVDGASGKILGAREDHIDRGRTEEADDD